MGNGYVALKPLAQQSRLLTPSLPGLRYRCRLILRGHGADLHDHAHPSLIHDHRNPLRLGHNPLYSLVRRLRPVWVVVHTREGRDGLGRAKDEERCLD